MLFVASALFWSVFEQAGSTLNLFADRSTDNTLFGYRVPEQLVPVAELAVPDHALAPVFAWIWQSLAKRGTEPSSSAKFALGLIFVGPRVRDPDRAGADVGAGRAGQPDVADA